MLYGTQTRTMKGYGKPWSRHTKGIVQGQ